MVMAQPIYSKAKTKALDNIMYMTDLYIDYHQTKSLYFDTFGH